MIMYRIQRRAEKSFSWLRGFLAAYFLLPFYKWLHIPIGHINLFERKIPFIERKEYAQNNEDGIINAIFTVAGTTNKYYVEFGVEDGIECNTRYLLKHKGWTGLLMDGSNENLDLNLCKEFITAENIEELFAKYDVPKEFDLLSIDIDGNDYWIWKAITHYSPRVVIMEYNACIPYEPPVTIPYNPEFTWDKTDYYGVSLSGLVGLASQKGYTLVGTDSHGVNAFFVRNDLMKYFAKHDPKTLYHPASFKGKPGNRHPKDTKNRPWKALPLL